MNSHETDRSLQALWRIESPKLIAHLARLTDDVGRAEELAQDAFVAALAQWPREGMPRNPGVGSRLRPSAVRSTTCGANIPSTAKRPNSPATWRTGTL